jgi:CspA family cold shock protein
MIRDFINRLFNLNKGTSSKEGTVKFFNYKKGYGFITVKDSEEEIFVHTKNLLDKIREKDQVTFNIEKSPKGPIATKVRVIK